MALLWACPSLSMFDSSNTYAIYNRWNKNATVHNASCGSEVLDLIPKRFGFHVPYSRDYPEMNHTVLTMFREPRDRLVSAFLFNEGIMLPRGYKIPPHAIAELKRNISNSPHPILSYAQLPGIASCQMKMLIGHNCGENVVLSEDLLNEAFRRLHADVAFFGLTEEPLATLELFHAMFGGYSLIKIPAIRQNSRYTNEYKGLLLQTLESFSWRDYWDDALYNEARRVFYQRCRVYNISTVKQHHGIIR